MNPQGRDKPHILFLFSDTGGGHRAAAEAIIEAIELEFHGRVTTEMVDIFRQYAPPPINLAPRIYPRLSRMPRVWKMSYTMSDGRRRARFAYTMLWPYMHDSIHRLLKKHPCSLVVSVHQLINSWVAEAAQENGIPFVTVVTDLVSTHAAWYSPKADMVIVPTAAAFKRGLSLRMPSTTMKVVGQPVADRFNRPAVNKIVLRERLGWRVDVPVAVLVGGGEGMGPLADTAFAIDAAGLPMQLVIVAGRNQALRRQLETHTWQIPVKIYGFVTEMPDFMRAADFLVSKAGPGTISEAFISGLPVILYSKMPGQEDGNVDFVVDGGAGVWAPEPDLAVKTLRRWLEDPKARQTAMMNALKLARPEASRRIARLLVEKAGMPVENHA